MTALHRDAPVNARPSPCSVDGGSLQSPTGRGADSVALSRQIQRGGNYANLSIASPGFNAQQTVKQPGALHPLEHAELR